MNTLVKICGLTTSADVKAAVAAGADAIGFVFHESSPRNLTPTKAAQLAADVPQDVRRVAVMMHPAPKLWQEVVATFHPDVLQTDHADYSNLNVADNIETWPVYREGLKGPDTLSLRLKGPDTFLAETFVYEGQSSGQGKTVDWKLAAQLAGCGRMILAGGLNSENVAQAIAQVRPFGVDVSSGVESRPGKKDAAKIAAFISAAKAASLSGSKDKG